MIKCCTILLLVSLGWSVERAQSAEMTPQEALDMVNQQERANGNPSLPPSAVTVRAYDVPDNECSQHLQTKSLIDKMLQALKGRRYFLVLYVPPPREAGGPVFGHAVCFFIDRDTRMPIYIDREN